MKTDELKNIKEKGHYDSALDDNLSMYDKITYTRDTSLCEYDEKKLYSGNIIKFYRYKYMDSVKPVYTVNFE